MNPAQLNLAAGVALVTFFAALVLTLWPSRARTISAAVLYCIGTLTSFGIVFGESRKYGWLRIESNLAQETVFLTYAINPSGSQNLEPSN